MEIRVIPYSEARKNIRVGDGFGFRSSKIVAMAIRCFRGGEFDFSHWSTCVEDTQEHGRVSMFEFIGAGPRRSYLSEAYSKEHGRVFWIPMQYTPQQQEKLRIIAADMETNNLDYDFGSTWGAILRPFIPMDAEKFNCSESGWFLGVQCGRLKPKYKNNKEIAPIPGDLPLWAECPAVFELDMSA